MDYGIILHLDKDKLKESLKKHTKTGVINFIVDPSALYTYEQLELELENKVKHTENNIKIFTLIKDLRTLKIFIDALLKYAIKNYKKMKDSSTQYIIYIDVVNVFGDVNQIVSDYHEKLKGLRLSIVFLK